MKRDFTKENLEKLIQLYDRLNIDENDYIIDMSESVLRAFRRITDPFGFSGVLHKMIGFTQGVGTFERSSRDRLQRIFEDISVLDKQYAGDTAGFGLTLNALEDLKTCMQDLTKSNNRGSDAVDQGQELRSYFNPSVIHETMLVSGENLDARLDALENGADFNSDNFSEVPNSVKRARIKEMEEQHPEYKKQFASVLSDPDLSEQEKLDIQYMAYSAPEPYRKLYLEHLDRYDVHVEKHDKKSSWYSPGSGEIHLEDDDETFASNPRGPYNTFFHESGHAIDDYEVKDGLLSQKDKTGSYKYNGKSLNDYITQDTRNYVINIMEQDEELSQLSAEQKEEILRNLNLSDGSSFNYGGNKPADPTLQRYQEELQYIMAEDLYGDVNESASDVYGGVTNNAIIGSYGHRKDKNDKDYTYWYETDPFSVIGGPVIPVRNGRKVSTGAQESELWAEFFAAKMNRDVEALESIRSHFPQAYEAMEHMAEEMAKS